jgi:hypothetical protein
LTAVTTYPADWNSILVFGSSDFDGSSQPQNQRTEITLVIAAWRHKPID